MHIECNRQSLLSGLQAIAGAVATKTTRPVLTCVRIKGEGDTLSLLTTDGELSAETSVKGVTCLGDGVVLIPASRLTAILNASTDESVTIRARGDDLRVTVGGGRFELPYMDPAEFPEPGEIPKDSTLIRVTSAELRQSMARILFAVERKESTRWAVTGAFLGMDGRTLVMVGTDTKRLAIQELQSGQSAEVSESTSALIPLRVLDVLRKFLPSEDDHVGIFLRKQDVTFNTERGRIVSRLVEGRFPPYRDIMPKKHGWSCQISPTRFLSAVRMAALMASEESKRVDLRFEADRIVLSARGADTGASEVVYDLPGNTQECELALDPQYLIELLRAVDDVDEITMEITDGSKPVVFRCEGYRHLIMPLGG